MLKKLIPLGAALGCSLTFNVYATETANEVQYAEVRDHYKTVIRRTPYTVEVCSEKKVSGDKTGDTVMGAIIGGVIGNNVTKNMPDGGTAGAIIGGILGNMNSTAKDGTQLVCNKLTRYKENMETIYSHSTITFRSNGRDYTVRFNK